MTRYTLAVLSDSPDYIHRFLAYCRDYITVFEVSGFTDMQALKEHVQICPVDMLLLPRITYMKGLDDWDDRNNIGSIVYLGERQDLSSSPAELNMYQPMSSLMDALADIASTLNIQRQDSGAKADILGIYVLDGELSVNDFVFSLAHEDSMRGRRILLIDLDSFSGIPLMHGFVANGSLSDLIYYFRTDPSKLEEHMKDFTVQSDGFYYLAPPVSPADITLISGSQLGNFFERLADAGHYDIVIISIPGVYPDLVELLGICRKIYLFSREYAAITDTAPGELARSFRAQAFSGYFIDRGRPDILTKCEDGYMTAASLPVASVLYLERERKFRINGKKRSDRTT